jgi:hypothetical protein
MKKYIYLSALAALLSTAVTAQTGNVGIGTSAPGSKLTVNGSFGATYRNISTDYTLTAGDHYLAWNGSAAGTVTLPAALAVGSGNYQGRVYHIKNTGTATLTLAANGSELIDNQSGAGVASVSLAPGYYAMIISKGTTTGTTWEVAIQTGILTGLVSETHSASQNINAASNSVMFYNTELMDDNGDFTNPMLTVTPASAGIWQVHVSQSGQNFSAAGSSNFNMYLQESTNGGASWVSIAQSGANVTGNENNFASIDFIVALPAGAMLRVLTVVCNGCTATGMTFSNKLFQAHRIR